MKNYTGIVYQLVGARRSSLPPFSARSNTLLSYLRSPLELDSVVVFFSFTHSAMLSAYIIPAPNIVSPRKPWPTNNRKAPDHSSGLFFATAAVSSCGA